MRLPSVSLNQAERTPGSVAIIVFASNAGMSYASNTTPRVSRSFERKRAWQRVLSCGGVVDFSYDTGIR